MLEKFVILDVISNTTKDGKAYYQAILYSVDYHYIEPVFIDNDTYSELEGLSLEQLVSIDISNSLTKSVYNGKPTLRLNRIVF